VVCENCCQSSQASSGRIWVKKWHQRPCRTGLKHYPAVAGESVSGTYCQRLNLTSGRFAMIEDGLGFSLVPWKLALERHLGRQVSGLARAETVAWSFGRKRTPGIN